MITFEGGHTAFDPRNCEEIEVPDPAACAICAATEIEVDLVFIEDDFYGTEIAVCENERRCRERQEANRLPFWQFMAARS